MKTLTIKEQLYLYRIIKRHIVLGTLIPQHIYKHLYNNLGILEWDSFNKNFMVNINRKPFSILIITTHVENDDIIRYKGIMTQHFAIWFKEIEKYYKIKTLL